MAQDNSCSHPAVLNLICTTCGQILHNIYGMSFEYIKQGLRLSHEEAHRLREIKTNNLLINKKLVLVLDLDHTLLHSRPVQNLTKQEKYLADAVEDLFQDSGQGPFITKFRPSILRFLREANTMFEMYIYTLGSQDYAKEIVNFLDPDNIYFDFRVIAKQDSTCPNKKNLDVVMHQESAIVILDDKESVWPMHRDNLIRVKKYKYFASKGSKSKSLAERRIGEDDEVLAAYLEALVKIHTQFFEVNFVSRDVRDAMKMVRVKILKVCKIVFRNISPYKIKCLSEKAEEMGAICGLELDSSVTHVVTEMAGHEELQWVKKKENNHLVNPSWIERSHKFWQWETEKYFALN